MLYRHFRGTFAQFYEFYSLIFQIIMEVLSSTQGFMLLAGYLLAMLVLVFFLRGGEDTKKGFLVAGRKMNGLVAAFSIAATWVWAPAMFVAAEKAYTQGFSGVFWFVVPNVLTLLLFGWYATKMRRQRPDGWTFSAYIRENYSRRCHNAYLVESFGLQICSLAVQLLAGATIMHTLTGIDFTFLTVLFAVIPLVYSFRVGLKASIMTDFLQMAIIIGVLFVGLPLMSEGAGGMSTLVKGLDGVTGGYSDLLGENGIAVMLSFGIPTTIGLLSGTFGDQMFWQRIFAVKKNHVGWSMALAALIFACVPVALSLFGFFAAGAGLDVENTQLTNLASVLAFTPSWYVWPFMILILNGLLSTVDSIICAVSSVTGHDIAERYAEIEHYGGKVKFGFKHDIMSDPIALARLSMIAVLALAIGIANIPGMTITYLFLFYGTLRSSVMLPTIWAIKRKKMSEGGLFWGIVLSLTIGLPIFAYGNLMKIVPMILAGSLLTILISGVMSRIRSIKGSTNPIDYNIMDELNGIE